MPIQPLSDATSRVLTSTQTLNNATSVIKELVDNAIDARACGVSIEVSANTLDKIVVKDDGIGIGVQDRQLLCKRGCTSKITDLDDLAMLGGTSLGFRGTALASIAELSKEITIITKVDGEQPATTMTFGSNGGLLSSASASHNDGTTVRVENFLASIPVRRQVVLKNPSKVLDEVKKLLQGYAFARPSVKLSLKVIKAKNDKANWSFAACKGKDQLLSAAAQIVGKAVTGLCRTQSAILDDESDEPAYCIHGLMLDAKSKDISKGGGVGQYITIDGRPVSQEKGVMRELIKTYKHYLQHACKSGSNVPSKPFIAIHLHCPARSYDVNVEPAKDVVLFHNQSKVLALAEKLFMQFYGDVLPSETDQEQATTALSKDPTLSSFDVLLARKKQPSHVSVSVDKHTEMQRPSELDGLPQTNRSLIEDFDKAVNQKSPASSNAIVDPPVSVEAGQGKSLKAHYNMCNAGDDLEDDPPQEQPTTNLIEEEEVYDPRDVTINNPFTRARIHSLRRSDPINIVNHSSDANQGLVYANTALETSSDPVTPPRDAPVSLSSMHHLPTPEPSPFGPTEPYQNPGPPFQRRPKRTRLAEGEEAEIRTENTSRLRQPHVQQQRISVGLTRSPTNDEHPSFQSASLINARRLREGLQQPSPIHSGQDIATTSRSRSPHKSTNKPFRSPLKAVQSSTSSHRNSEPHDAFNGQLQSSSDPTQPPPILSPTDDADLQNILAFEHRKKAVNQRQKLNQATLNPADLARIQKSSDVAADLILSQSSRLEPNSPTPHDSNTTTPKPTTSNPHQNRYAAAIRHLEHPQPSTSLTPTDPRTHLIQHRTFTSHSALENHRQPRIRTSKLPFETIPPDARNHDLLAVPSDPFPSVHDLADMTGRLRRCDAYVGTGRVECVQWTRIGDDEVNGWQQVLQGLVREKYHEGDGDGVPELEIGLAAALRTHVEEVS